MTIAALDASARARKGERASRLRSVPIRWRILAVAVVNTIGVLVLAFLVVRAADGLGAAWGDLVRARNTDRLLVSVGSDAERLQSLIHRYFTQPTEPVLQEIDRRRAGLMQRLDAVGAAAVEAGELPAAVQRLSAGFEELKTARANIVSAYETRVLASAREMTGLYTLIEGATPRDSSLIWPALTRSRDAFSTAIVAVNSFYLSQDVRAAHDTRESLSTIERTAPYMVDLAENDLQRDALRALHARAGALLAGFTDLATAFTVQNELLRTAVDESQASLAGAIDRLSAATRRAEEAAQARFDAALSAVYLRIALAGGLFLLASILVGIGAARSISGPLEALKTAMGDIVAERQRTVAGLDARDEIGDMARAVNVFQENAIARRQAEAELRAAKERAEATLVALRETQATLVNAEKFAALGALVAGVAHEVNNPVGISLTVASSLARRCDAMETALEAGPLRRSQLAAFIADNRDAANQLVANLHRAGELVQAFKQVAVDRTHADRRGFDLAETTRQIAASLLPGLRKTGLGLEVAIPDGIALESYPGPYGQVLTNLVLNCVAHAYPAGRTGVVRIGAERAGEAGVALHVADDGVGMGADVLRQIFEPFFTTKRGAGGTGLGLHIVHNLVTFRLGGRITAESSPGHGTRFTLTLPLVAPGAPAAEDEPIRNHA
ncbi:sensor histidine kinase [Salinarimonas soli]|uniref:histidine kinase n=1 Tax=Salinarimonas soli TaxID=1638099 RepID=A0A5B2V3S7_9HYPH|nr:HAMP domain-containing sensor histidine kinase [Salinarimonas soli]KAA2234123.1 HAMP domain-containing histidine kinase [Salinarimonas soli]